MSSHRSLPSRCIRLSLATALAAAGAWANAQTPAGPPTQQVAAAPVVTWASLTPPQQTALAPLQSTWTTLTDANRRKWIALSHNFANMSAGDRDKLHARMAEWAALKPNERQQARLNFAETKKTPPAQREAGWEAYQALSPEEKAALAGKAPVKPAGAAIAAKAPPPQKLTPVPLTRNSPEAQREKLTAQQPVNRNTLLPAPPPPPAPPVAPPPTPAPAPAIPAKPPEAN